MLWEAKNSVGGRGQHQPSHVQSGLPGPSLGWGGLLLHSVLLSVLGEGQALALAGRIPARVSGRRAAQRALPDWHVLVGSREPVVHTPSLPGPGVSVSPVDVSTHTYTYHPTPPHLRVLLFTQHPTYHLIPKAEHTRYTATQRNPTAPTLRPAHSACAHRHHGMLRPGTPAPPPKLTLGMHRPSAPRPSAGMAAHPAPGPGPPHTEQVPRLHAGYPALTRVPVRPTHCAHALTHAYTHIHRPSVCAPRPQSWPRAQSPEQSSLPSVQFPDLMGLSQMPACLSPRSLPPGGRLRAKPRRSWEPTGWLLPWMCSHNHCNHSTMLGTMPLWEPPPSDLDCPLVLPGEGEVRLEVQRGGWLPTSLKGPAGTLPPGLRRGQQGGSAGVGSLGSLRPAGGGRQGCGEQQP